MESSSVDTVVTTIIFKVGLQLYSDTKAGQLSGGNKRKLCLAMAIIGRPELIIIDEASAGVDPSSRRIIWNAIKEEGKESATVITTHTMEEAEAISDRIGIMVQGSLKCLGTLARIQQEYGLGYDIEINLDTGALFRDFPAIPEDQRYSSKQSFVSHML